MDHPESVSAEDPLHRLTVFLTYRCNLDCPYCKTIARSPAELAARPQKRETFDHAAFRALLDAHRGTPIRHLHFTGGEPALVADVAEMIASARAAGVEAISMTSNGTLPAETYLRFAEAGLDELRLSIDADEPVLGAALTGRASAWPRAVATLRTLGTWPGREFFLIVNAVIGPTNRARVPELVAFLLGFGVDDIKLITDVDHRGALADPTQAAALLAEVAAQLERFPPEAFPLLRRKIRTVFAPDAIGLDRAFGEDWRCFVPLTERTVDGAFYYPCSVYLREGGAPLGALSDPPDVQRANSARFVREGDCLRDPICLRYCLHCTASYNQRANEARR